MNAHPLLKPQVTAHEWEFYLSPAAAWDAMYEDCARACVSIEMEQYIFNDDAIGRKFLELMITKAKRGVAVRLLCDEVGSRSLLNSHLVATLRAHGGKLEFYNSLKVIDILKPKRLFPRTHVKALVVDGAIAHIGGVCLAQHMERWRDTQIRITGDAVDQIAEALAHNRAVGGHAPRPPKFRPEHYAGCEMFYLQNDPGLFRHPIYQAMLDAIRSARETIWISEAFFIPTRRLRRYLRQAVARGVEVIVLLPEHSDFWVADWVTLSYASRLLSSGVRIFRYQPTVLHTKTMVVDECWATVGSCNMDSLSFFHNRESNLIMKNRDVSRAMHEQFLNDLEMSNELTLEYLHAIPLWKRAFARFARIFRPLL